ncbi:MAG TPA: hypothetical protein PLY99_08570, partial [Acidovorax temperans]|nr:hypothetical protein [Acidovorax temperans]
MHHNEPLQTQPVSPSPLHSTKGITMAMNMGASPTLGMAWRAAALAMLTLLAGCDRIAFWVQWKQAAADLTRTFPSKPLPDPVQSKDGVAYIPIDD